MGYLSDVVGKAGVKQLDWRGRSDSTRMTDKIEHTSKFGHRHISSPELYLSLQLDLTLTVKCALADVGGDPAIERKRECWAMSLY